MKFKRMWTMFTARNREFFRDRAGFGWNLLFPFLIVAGFGLMFGGKPYAEFKVGVIIQSANFKKNDEMHLPEPFKRTEHIQFIRIRNLKEGLFKLDHHKIDFLIQAGAPPYDYWVNETSPKGYIVERLFTASLSPKLDGGLAKKYRVSGKGGSYLSFLFPGILGMNMMFSALYGIGYVIVLYRKNGVLKRLKATPLTAYEYLGAQLLSRLFVLMFSIVIVWIGCSILFSFEVKGSYFAIFFIYLLGGMSLSSLGMILASRGTSEEFTNGLLNFITWPMMFLSEVWFSIEGAPSWVKVFSNFFPLTHILRAVRLVMNDGATLLDVGGEIAALSVMTAVFLMTGGLLFRWNR